ncbi:MAG: biotin/lipoyl-containing protein, partial [Acidimicrobiia bacterium]
MEVTMPQLGETVTEGTVTRWLKQVGERVEADELLFEVSTDKVDSEVPSPVAGYLSEIVVPEGETVPVGARLAVLGDAPPGQGAPAEGGATPRVEAAPAEPDAEAAAPPTGNGRTQAVPAPEPAAQSEPAVATPEPAVPAAEPGPGP